MARLDSVLCDVASPIWQCIYNGNLSACSVRFMNAQAKTKFAQENKQWKGIQMQNTWKFLFFK